MHTEEAAPQLRYLEPAHAEIAGMQCDGMTIRAHTGRALGWLQGFVVDPVARQIRYVIVRGSGVFSRSRLVPMAAARVDLEGRAIELPIDEQELRHSRRFMPDAFPAFSDDDLVAAMFARR